MGKKEREKKGRREIAVNCQVENVKRELPGVRARQGWCRLGRTLHAFLWAIGKVRYPSRCMLVVSGPEKKRKDR